jgi:uncharacterized protein (DUF486 family)
VVWPFEIQGQAAVRRHPRELGGIAFFEYCFQVPANRWGSSVYSAAQLKIIQEVITLSVFVVFAIFYLGEKIRWNYVAAFGCILAAVAFAFWPHKS